MINCIILDDEKPAREELSFLLKGYDDIGVLAEAKHGLEALDLISELDIDLIFLDIEMPKVNGIEVAEKILNNNNPPFIVFVTAYNEYAIKAFELNAIDYILKPFSKDRLDNTINKVLKRLDYNSINYKNRLENLLCEIENKSNINKVCLYKNGSYIPVLVESIIYATVVDKSTLIFTENESYEYQNSLSQLEETLNLDNFFRSHRSFIINLDFIEKIEPWFNSTYQVKLKCIKEKIPVSRSQVKSFKKIMKIT
ncbi:LytR/AlgR family response regulator transcription factor [Dethiothermospora halolimnae]|uniref:LytR/AlgR family response regulator transcription factor n=1 Tax=Dethiothermospora halolimnae TaxID=3114390 RepID=UPI003CCBAD7F